MRSRRSSRTEALTPRRWQALLARQQCLGLVAGVDEAGRGPLAGPVVAAAVILDELQPIKGLADSKRIGPVTRERNILQATLLAMRRAVDGLRLRPRGVLVDGKHLPPLAVPARAVVRGDATVAAISAASILAKVHRDRLCAELDRLHPQYGFAAHKGYPTAEHLAALGTHGPCAAHRRSFAPVAAALGRR